jgi:membrane-bound serine protease (ClpP class)
MRHRSRLRLLLAPVFLLLGLFALAGAGRAAGPEVVVLPTTGVVDNVMAGYLGDGIAQAADEGAAAVVIQLNTPGGSLDATQRITSALLEAPIPTIVYVAPAGGRAASAGTFITLAANLAFMAPGTNIGAASPVGGGGEDIEGTLGEKVLNDAIKNITAIAEARGRPVDWAVSTVEEAASYAASEAVAAGAVDGIAISVDDVLAAAHGRVVDVRGSEVTLNLTGATAREIAMNPLQGFLHLLSDPNIAFVLFTIGVYGLIFELQNPNFVTGILGALALILAFIGFGSLPLNVAGLLLIALGVVLFVLETQVTSHGLLTVGGIICFVLGASALYTLPGDPTGPIVQVATPVLVVMTTTTAILMGLVAVAALRTRRMPAPAGTVGGRVPIGTLGIVQSPLSPVGTAFLAGEPWSARAADGRPISRDAAVRLVAFDGLTAVVEPSTERPAVAPETPPPADMT